MNLERHILGLSVIIHCKSSFVKMVLKAYKVTLRKQNSNFEIGFAVILCPSQVN